MMHTLPWSEAVYGMGAGIFFVVAVFVAAALLLLYTVPATVRRRAAEPVAAVRKMHLAQTGE